MRWARLPPRASSVEWWESDGANRLRAVRSLIERGADESPPTADGVSAGSGGAGGVGFSGAGVGSLGHAHCATSGFDAHFRVPLQPAPDAQRVDEEELAARRRPREAERHEVDYIPLRFPIFEIALRYDSP